MCIWLSASYNVKFCINKLKKKKRQKNFLSNSKTKDLFNFVVFKILRWSDLSSVLFTKMFLKLISLCLVPIILFLMNKHRFQEQIILDDEFKKSSSLDTVFQPNIPNISRGRNQPKVILLSCSLNSCLYEPLLPLNMGGENKDKRIIETGG